MLAYADALDRLLAAAPALPPETVALADAAGRVLAADVTSDRDLPPFAKSAMDGYACRRADLAQTQLTVIEEIAAGAWPQKTIGPGQCARILTGAPMPTGADCVVMQEQVERAGDRIRLQNPETADNFCRQGEDLRAGEVVLRRGERLGPAHLAVLAAVGCAAPRVATRPRVVIFATGNELVDPAAHPGPAQIRDSNSCQLAAQLQAMGALAESRGRLADDAVAIAAALDAAAPAAELLLLSGGVSTGDFDLVPPVLRQLGFASLFDSVAMQPGRPTLFARRGTLLCGGLPGNPVSTYLMCELFVKPLLFRMMGHEWQPPVVAARLATTVRRRNLARQAAIPVRFTAPGEVTPVEYHGSAHIAALTRATGLLTLPVGVAGFDAGATVHVRLLPA